MSEMYQSFEQDFCKSLNSIQKKVSSLPNQSKELKELAITEGVKEISDAEKCLRQMEIELSMMPAASRAQIQSQVRRYREDFEQTKRAFRQEEASYADQKSRETLMGARLDNGFGRPNEHRERLLNTHQVVADQNNRLDEGKRIALEAEGVAIETMNQLKGQRDLLTRSISNNREVGNNLSKGNTLINTMTRRAIQNKLLVIGIVILLLGVMCLLVYMKLR